MRLPYLFDTILGEKKNDAVHGTDYYSLQFIIIILATFFDAMSGVKKPTNFIPVITYSTSVNEPAYNNSENHWCRM